MPESEIGELCTDGDSVQHFLARFVDPLTGVGWTSSNFSGQRLDFYGTGGACTSGGTSYNWLFETLSCLSRVS